MREALLYAAFAINIFVAGVVGLQMLRGSEQMLTAFGGDSSAARILACLYLAIAAASVFAISGPRFGWDTLWTIAKVLLPIQIFYKVLSLVVVHDPTNPVLWFNGFIAAFHAVAWTVALRADP